MSSPEGLKLSFLMPEGPKGIKGELPCVTLDGAWYTATYRYECRAGEWWAVLETVHEIMPPTPPQLKSFDDSVRWHMMREDGSLDFEAEAAKRREEWAEANREALSAKRS